MENPKNFSLTEGCWCEALINWAVKLTLTIVSRGPNLGSWSFLGSNFCVRNESVNEMINQMNHILNCEYEIVMDAISNFKFREVLNFSGFLASTQASTRFSHTVVFVFPTIWEPGTGYGKVYYIIL